MNVGVVAAVIVDDRLNDLTRLLRRRCVVKVDERLVVNLAVQDGKVGSYALNV